MNNELPESSIFTELLNELSKYSYEIDWCMVSNDHFVDFKRLENRIERAHNIGYINEKEKDALMVVANILHKEYIDVLKLRKLL